MNKDFISNFIKDNPFDFKEAIIAHCRTLDKYDVYQWVADDEVKINNLLEENRQLKEQLEEDKDIELLDVALLSQSDNWLWCPSKEDFEKDIELNSYIISNIRENTLNFQRKLNEVIKEVNKLRK